jgi:hypothetical protein
VELAVDLVKKEERLAKKGDTLYTLRTEDTVWVPLMFFRTNLRQLDRG